MSRTKASTNGARTPPHDDDAEAALLGAMLLTYDAAAAGCDTLRPDDFYRPAHGHIFEAIVAAYEDGDPIDSITVGNRVQAAGLLESIGGPAKLTELIAGAGTTSSARKYAELIATAGAQRRMLYAINTAAEAIYDGEPDRATVLLDGALDIASQAAGDSRQFTPTDLADAVAGEPVPPEMLTRWLYLGGFHVMQSEPGVGKSWLALWQAIEVMKAGGTVIYLDEENGPELTTERLQALNVDVDLLRARFRYFPFEGRSWDAADTAALEALLRRLTADGHTVRLAVLDSLPNMLASAGVDENSATEVTEFVARIVKPLRLYDTTVVALDHLTKPAAGAGKSKSRSRYARGSGAKLAVAAATIHVETGREFTRHGSGFLKVWRTKDRRGALDLPSLEHDTGGRRVDAKVNPHESAIEFLEGTNESPAEAAVGGLPTSAMELVSAHLARNAQRENVSQARVLTEVHGFRKTVLRQSLEALVEYGFVKVERGARNAKLYRHVKLYHESEPLPDKVADVDGLELF